LLEDKEQLLTYEAASEFIRYCPNTGVFYRFKRLKRRTEIKIAGTVYKENYIEITIKGRRYRAHRLAFLLMTKSWPKGYVDHIDRNGKNNRWCNLRQATPSENMMNRSIQKNSATGVPGVCWMRKNKRWRAYIKVNREYIHLGLHRNIDDAINARHEAEEKYFGEFSPRYTHAINQNPT